MAKNKLSLSDDEDLNTGLGVDLADETDADDIIDFGVDLTDAEPSEPLPDGTYIGTIIKAEKREVKNHKGSFYIAATFLISPDQFPADYDASNAPEEGKSVTYRKLSLAETRDARYDNKVFLLAVGYPLGRRVSLSGLITLSAKLTLKTEIYNGIPRNAIDRVEAID